MTALPHDFTRPGRLEPSWQHRLTGWFRVAFSLANKAWAKQLPFAVEASLLDLDVCYPHQGPAAVPEATCGYRVMVAQDRLATFLALPRSLLLQIIAALLGDKEPAERDREFTPIEESLAEYFLAEFWLPFFREAWPGAEVPTWQLQPREANPRCTRAFASAEPLIQMNWQMRGPWGDTNAIWFFHRKALGELLGETAACMQDTVAQPIIAARREAIVINLPVLVEIALGSAELKLSELSRLQVGDVLLLDQRHDEEIILQAGGENLFRGKAGRVGSWKAFQVEGIDET